MTSFNRPGQRRLEWLNARDAALSTPPRYAVVNEKKRLEAEQIERGLAELVKRGRRA